MDNDFGGKENDRVTSSNVHPSFILYHAFVSFPFIFRYFAKDDDIFFYYNIYQ